MRAAAACLAESGAGIDAVQHPSDGHGLMVRVWESYRGEMPSGELYRVLADWDGYRRRMLEWFQPYDALLCPAYDRPAPRFGEPETGLGLSYTTPYSLTGWPCAVVRCGTSAEGLPITAQVVAHPWRDDVALSVARHASSVAGAGHRCECPDASSSRGPSSPPGRMSIPRSMKQFARVLCLASVVVAAGCGGSSGAEGSVRQLYEMSQTLEGPKPDLEDVSCSNSVTPEPTPTVTFYDCTLEYEGGGSDLWCVVEGSARSAPLPLPCTGVPAEYFTAR